MVKSKLIFFPLLFMKFETTDLVTLLNRDFLLGMLLIFMTYSTPVRLLVTRTDMRRSSTISTTQDHVLEEYIIHKQRTYNFLTCAQLCLARPDCMSFNYENIKNGVCELNNASIVVDRSALFAQRGYLFCQLVNISVSIQLLRYLSTADSNTFYTMK